MLLKIITEALKSYINKKSSVDIFEKLLNSILELTNSEYGFIGEVLYDEDKLPYLKTMAITNIAWNDTLKELFKYDKTGGIVFKNLNTLFGIVLTEEKILISNDPKNDDRRGGELKCPIGHPPLKRFCGIPFFMDGKFVGMVGIANAPEDYTPDIEQKYEVFLNTCSLLIHSIRERRTEESLRENQMNFISQISHELKTPLNSIMGFAQLLQIDYDADYVNYIITGGKNLLNIINNSLNINHIDKYDIKPVSIPIKQSIDMAVTEYKKSIDKLGLNIINNIPGDLYTKCDDYLYKSIITNLISNAIKYNIASGSIIINYKLKKNKIFISIKNNGTLKISPDNLYKPFHTSTKYSGGTGLGLSLVKNIIVKINEEIDCIVRENTVQFTFSIPFFKKTEKKILYLEDNEENQVLMKKILKKYSLTCKYNAHDFIDYVHDYDILLLDLNLNSINGFDVMEIIVKNNIKIPVIIITADTTLDILKTIKEYKIKHFYKPLPIMEFLSYIKTLM